MIHLASTIDLPSINLIQHACFQHFRFLTEADLCNPLFFIYEKTDICGFIYLKTFPSHPKLLWISEIAVHPNSQRHGIGQSLINFAIQFAISHDFEEIGLYVLPDNLPAVNLYLKCGFKQGVSTPHMAYFIGGSEAPPPHTITSFRESS